jgi:hypothetical protein
MAPTSPTTALSRTSLAHSGGVRGTLSRQVDRIGALLAQTVALDLPPLGQLGARLERINPRCIAKICRLIYVFHRVGLLTRLFKKTAVPFGGAAVFAVSGGLNGRVALDYLLSEPRIDFVFDP